MARARDLSKVKVEPLSRSSSLIFKKPGQTFRGVYVRARKTKYEGREVVIHVLEDKDGNPHDVWESAALKDLALVKPGAVVEIKFLGKKKSVSNPKRKFNNFLLSVEPGGLKKAPRD